MGEMMGRGGGNGEARIWREAVGGEAHPGLAERLGWARLAEPGGQPYEQIHLQAVRLGLHMPHCSPWPWMGL